MRPMIRRRWKRICQEPAWATWGGARAFESKMVTSLTAGAVSFFSRSRGGCETGQSSPEDVARGVLVGVDGVPAPSTGEHRLCGAVLSCGVPAGFAAVG